ncbi:Dyp-type peroxidase [Acidiferrimicrobium sp. IK]|uniref:Dyp-type peroxidase n=1 Tax=Acidiferrimicrobium sp. IK TaxID=2871700 RepID=UPI0021CB5C4E|nr:Dyp-type peroxidase [Acidiferrimicrobium sp. IK]MCU4186064.1 Dyp-type peroxidase [Acidiferrimicrobium sp. IK]
MTAQPGIFALGTIEHCYLELDLVAGADPAGLVGVLAWLCGPGSPLAGVSVTVAVRPELWAEVAPEHAPPGVRSFEAIVGPELTMPATQHDAWVWVAGGGRDIVFDSARKVLDAAAGVATVGSEITGWVYRHDRDLTGFIDGTENPSVVEAPGVAVRAGAPGAGSSVVLVQRWRHLDAWAALGDAEQELVIGRSKPDSVELDDERMPADSHVSRNVVEEDGEELAIYRRNTAYGGPTDHGTLFVGFCAEQHPLQIMLERMAGVGDGIRDALTRYTTPLSGSYYLAPSLDALQAFLPPDLGVSVSV